MEYYTADNNANIFNGILTIEARKENADGRNYTSARMVTKNKGDFLFGRMEVSARLQAGRFVACNMDAANRLGVWRMACFRGN